MAADDRCGGGCGARVAVVLVVVGPGVVELRRLLPGVVEAERKLSGAVRDQYHEAIRLASGPMLRARAGQAPGATACAFDDTESFSGEFFPGEAGGAGRRLEIIADFGDERVVLR